VKKRVVTHLTVWAGLVDSGRVVIDATIVVAAVVEVAVVEDNVTVDLNSFIDKQSSPRLLLLAVTVMSGLVLELTFVWDPSVGWTRSNICVSSRTLTTHVLN